MIPRSYLCSTSFLHRQVSENCVKMGPRPKRSRSESLANAPVSVDRWPYKVCDVTGTSKKGVMASGLADLVVAIKTKFRIDPERELTVMLAEDDTEIDEDEFFQTLPAYTMFKFILSTPESTDEALDAAGNGGAADPSDEEDDMADDDGSFNIIVLCSHPRLEWHVRVTSADSVLMLKEKLMVTALNTADYLPVAHLRLSFGAAQLVNDRSLSDYGIGAWSAVLLDVVRPPVAIPTHCPYQIFIKTLANTTITREVRSSDTVEQLRKMIRAHTSSNNVPIEHITLRCGSKTLDDERTLAACSVGKHSTVFATARYSMCPKCPNHYLPTAA